MSKTTSLEDRPKLGVVLPLANEAATVRDLLARIVVQLTPDDMVFCVLDNACRDNTKDIITTIAGSDGRIKLVWAPENRCVVDAYFRGYREALAMDCEWILEMDGGLSHLPEEIPRFLVAMRSGVDFAGGSRFIAGGTHGGSWRRIFVSRAGSVLAACLLQTRMHDMTSGFQCFTRTSLQAVIETGVRSRAHFFQTEIRFMMSRRKWVEVPISYGHTEKSVGFVAIQDALLNLGRLSWQHHVQRNR